MRRGTDDGLRMRISKPGVLVALASLTVGSALLATTASAAATTVTFNSPGLLTLWTVPTGVHAIVVDVAGAQGGAAWSGMPGGLGGRTTATLSVTPGEDLVIGVGQAGGDSPKGEISRGAGGANGGGLGGLPFVPTFNDGGFGGGGGGGASDIRRGGWAVGNRVIVAGGGGGGSLTCIGGGGGGVVGGSSPNCTKWIGGGGFPNMGGFGGSKENDLCCSAGFSGTFGQGGDGAMSGAFPGTGEGVGGGGGGGGWYGGGGGGGGLHVPNTGLSSMGGGSGGGGSSYADPATATNVAYSTGVWPGSGRVTLTWAVPVVSVSVAPSANANGWNNTDVGVTFTGSNPGGPAIASIGWSTTGTQSYQVTPGNPVTVNIGTEGTTTVQGFARDAIGSDSAWASATVRVDKTPPTLTSSITPAPNSRGWNNTNVTVSWGCADALSGVAHCSWPATLSNEGAAQSVAGSSVDRAGNVTSAVVSVNIDKTPPVLTGCAATDLTDTRAVIRWSTSEPADSQVEFGPTSLRGTWSPLDSSLVASHAVTLQGLTPGTTYHAQARSADVADNAAACPDFTFTTKLHSYSLSVDGVSGYAEAPHANDLNVASDWTIELWFKDEDSNGFNHDYVTLLTKGDRQSSGETPYFVSIGYKQLLVGLRSGGVDYSVAYDLWNGGVDASLWHHVAATFDSSDRALTIYLDGTRVASGKLKTATKGNTLPVEIGRNGPLSGKYFHGKLDDIRIWNKMRTEKTIRAEYRLQLAPAPSTLVANWQFEEGAGLLAADTTARHHDATLTSGATFSTDVHP